MKIQPGVGYNFDSSSRGFTLDTSEPFPDPIASVYYHPFEVTNLGLKPSTSDYFFKVQPGLVNNLDPMIGGSTYFMTHMPVSDYEFVLYKWNFNPTTGYSYIVLKLGYEASIGQYPDSNTAHVSASPSYPVVDSISFMPVTNDTDSYVILATAYQDPTTKAITIWQDVSKSLWTDRIKVSTLAAKYYFASI